MSNTSDDRSFNCAFPERSEAEGFDCEPNSQSNHSASLLSGKTPFQGQSTEGGQGMTSGQKRKTNELVGKPKGNNNESKLTRHEIHELTERGNISFKYDEAKMARSVAAAEDKMAEKPDCDHLECTQCKELFPGEPELRKHFDSEQHLAKVREKSEKKTLGDLNKTFTPVRQLILEEIPGLLPAKQVSSQGQTAAGLPPGQTELSLGGSFDELSADPFALFDPFTNGEEEMSPESLQNMVVELKKYETKGDFKEDDLGYKFGNKEYYRIMSVLKNPYSSVQELVANLVICSFTTNRGSYGERQSNGGRSEEEKESKKRKKAPKKRKKADEKKQSKKGKK